MAGQSIVAGTFFEPMMVKNGVDSTSVEGVADSPYLTAIANHRIELHSPKTPISVLWWRSVGHSHNGFVMESLVDEAAHAAGTDPLEYRRRLLAKHPRHLGVLNLAAAKAGWGTPTPAGRARGIAVHESFGSFVAQVAEVSTEGGRIRVHRVTCAIDCGVAVNPLMIEAQMQSGIAYGLERGAAQRSHAQGRPGPGVELPRLPGAPARRDAGGRGSRRAQHREIGRRGRAGGAAGAPAVANAVFALTGQRLRELPLQLPPA